MSPWGQTAGVAFTGLPLSRVAVNEPSLAGGVSLKHMACAPFGRAFHQRVSRSGRIRWKAAAGRARAVPAVTCLIERDPS